MFSSLKSLIRGSESNPIAVAASVQDERSSLWVSQISPSKLAGLSFASRIRFPVPNVDHLAPNPSSNFAPSVTSLSALRSVYQSAELVKASKPAAFTIGASLVVPDVSYKWHLPETSAIDVSGSSSCASEKNRTVVVLTLTNSSIIFVQETYGRCRHFIISTTKMSTVIHLQLCGDKLNHSLWSRGKQDTRSVLATSYLHLT